MPPGSDSASWDLHAEAPAKLNLGLAVVGKRSDGFHDLLTVFQAVDLMDHLSFRRAPGSGISLEIAGPEAVPAGEDNLVWRAADLLRREVPGLPGLAIRLRKYIPAGTGLGGGSSDAAATLLALNQLWNLQLPPARLADMALQLGSDVPFFLLGGTAVGEGRGERLRPLPAPPGAVYRIFIPDIRLSTKQVFSAISEELTVCIEKVNLLVKSIESGDAPAFFENLVNDLLTGVVRIQPRLAQSLREPPFHGALALGLTGSGSAFFGLFQSEGDADAFVERKFLSRKDLHTYLDAANTSWRVVACSPVSFGARVVPEAAAN